MSNLANNNELKEQLKQDILALTNKLREEKPTVYEQLDENPVTLPDEQSPDLLEGLKKYKDTLEELLA